MVIRDSGPQTGFQAQLSLLDLHPWWPLLIPKVQVQTQAKTHTWHPNASSWKKKRKEKQEPNKFCQYAFSSSISSWLWVIKCIICKTHFWSPVSLHVVNDNHSLSVFYLAHPLVWLLSAQQPSCCRRDRENKNSTADYFSYTKAFKLEFSKGEWTH